MIVLANHGCSTLGDTVEMAWRRALNLEEAARQHVPLPPARRHGHDVPRRPAGHGPAPLTAGLGLVTIAEGIEDAEQRDRLVSLGCSVGQGYLFARPMAEAAAAEFLRSHLAPAGGAVGDGRDRGAAA